MEIYYWKNTKWLEAVSFADDKELGRYPTKAEFKRDWKKLPISIPYYKMLSLDENLSSVFEIMNTRNPMGTPEKQRWIRKNLQPHPHTSMSVGDVVKVNKKYYLVLDVGWKKMRW